ncbi:hypothetical protein [Bacteroides sp. 224]|uniref:hypothetical protein n=1 Tax=Bacteroides sp. 224 TaxID=2302936 RepID=UPI0013D4C877|nr:hypothetical protein [Bacteroides sp. 224]NDV66411.1 hypothetical protein [Bacteroides sp. 224]
MKNLLINFIDWYIENNEGKTANYLANNFNDDKDLFIAEVADYAVEFALAYGYNPFKVDKEKIAILKKDVYTDDSSFGKFSAPSHMPRAILGDNNYLKFLEVWYADKEATELKKPRKKTITYHHEREEIRKNFTLRLATQDRFYNFLYFPVSVLKKLFYKKERKAFFDNWINHQMDNITVYGGPSLKLLFKDVETLDIDKDGVVLINGKHRLHTVVSAENAVVEACVTNIKSLVIDHVESFQYILYALKDQLPTLRTIHNVLENINDGAISNRGELTYPGNYLVDNVDFTDAELDSLEKEMNLILSKINLQLMDKSEHLGKKK